MEGDETHDGDEIPMSGEIESPDGLHVPAGFRSGYVALVGAPNVGKSTLMNQILAQKLAIVTPKPQTTRRRTLGILTSKDYQVVLLDTPGMMEPKYGLHEAMLREAIESLRDADVILYMVEGEANPHVIPEVASAQAKKVLVLNKVDRVSDKRKLLPLLAGYGEMSIFDAIVPLSALTGEGLPDLLEEMVRLLPEGPPFYPPDQIAEQSERFFVAEIVREKVFELYEQEVPYSTEVIVHEFHERAGAKDFIEAWIYVETQSQKKIVIGKGGSAVRTLGEAARQAVEEFLDREVFLSLRVRLLPKWRKREDALRKLGYKT